jgi:hypothetical protein
VSVDSPAEAEVACLEQRSSFASVDESLRRGGAPVAVAVVDHLGGVLSVEPGGPDDDGWPQVTINVYERHDGCWVSHGGGGFDWDWPIGHVPEGDEGSANRIGTPLDDTGRGVWFVPHYGPKGAWLEAVVDDTYPWGGSEG